MFEIYKYHFYKLKESQVKTAPGKSKTQRNNCVRLLRKTKQQNFKNLNLNDITDNKTFWLTMKPYFNEKGSGSKK